MKVFNKNGNEINLIQGMKDIVITPYPGYELLYNYSYATDELAFIIAGIKKNNGVFTMDDDDVARMDVTCKLGTSYCGLGNGTNWNVNSIGYTFVNSNSIIVSDRNELGTQDRAYINLVCRLSDTST